MNKENILDEIHNLISKNVIGSKQLMSRYKGFRGELFFENLLSHKFPDLEILTGGIIMSKDSVISSLDNSIYLTILPLDTNLDNYISVYKSLAKIGFKKMFIIFHDENWHEKEVMHFENEIISMPVPSFKIMEFDKDLSILVKTDNRLENVTGFLVDFPKRSKNKYEIEPNCKEWLLKELSQFNRKQLLNIYMNRLFFDGYVGFSKNKGKCSDIDLIIKKPSGEYRLIEIKEKNLPKSGKGFGLDVPRINDMKRIEQISGLEYHLVVRHINNQTDRKLVGWKYIALKDFINDVKDSKIIEGGTGMRSSYSSNPTLICNLSQFKFL